MVVIASPDEAGDIIEGTPAFMQVGRVVEQKQDERVLFRD
jgi:hypothetical protein